MFGLRLKDRSKVFDLEIHKVFWFHEIKPYELFVNSGN